MGHRHVAKSCSYSAGRIDYRPFVPIQTRWLCFEDIPIMVRGVLYYHHKAREKRPEWRHQPISPLLWTLNDDVTIKRHSTHSSHVTPHADVIDSFSNQENNMAHRKQKHAKLMVPLAKTQKPTVRLVHSSPRQEYTYVYNLDSLFITT